MRKFLSILFLVCSVTICFTQDSAVVLSVADFDITHQLFLANKERWSFKLGNDVSWASPDLEMNGWKQLGPNELTPEMADEDGKLEGWLRIKIRLDSSLNNLDLGFMQHAWASSDLYIDGDLVHSFGSTGLRNTAIKEYNFHQKHPIPFHLDSEMEHVLAMHIIEYMALNGNEFRSDLGRLIILTAPDYIHYYYNNTISQNRLWEIILAIISLITFLCWLIYFLNIKERHLLMIAITLTFLPLISLILKIQQLDYDASYLQFSTLNMLPLLFFILFNIAIPLTVGQIFKNRIPKWHWVLAGLQCLGAFFIVFFTNKHLNMMSVAIYSSIPISAYYIISSWKNLKPSKWAVVCGLALTVIFAFNGPSGNQWIAGGIFLSLPLTFLIYISLWLKESRLSAESNAQKMIQLAEEKKEILTRQNELLEKQVKTRTAELSQSLENLKTTQGQLIQSEKMASLGELTAGIAHEIQNPLNFVNNFSEVSNELMDEMNEEIEKGDLEEAKLIAKDIKQNLEKINHHGKRADAIVKGMLQHSRKSTAEKEPTDINKLADEYLRLAYHGLRAKDKSFNATLETDFDESIGLVNVIPQDMGRVILNLITNAFYAVNEKRIMERDGFNPTVSVSTRRADSPSSVIISVKDNGNGMPKHVLDKIFQPFFTTKPTGEGTGLGLSMSYDIVKAHGGELSVHSMENEGTEFIIQLPIKSN